MKKEVDVKYFMISQNNSGGYYIQNDNVDKYVVVEALNAQHAEMLLDEITGPYSWYCSCCGLRWNTSYFHHTNIFNTIDELKNFSVWNEQTKCCVHYLDGTVEKIEFNKYER